MGGSLEHDSDTTVNCRNEALGSGFLSGLKAAVGSGGMYYLAMKHSEFFRTRFSASARTALVVMPIFYSAWLNVELSMHNCMAKAAADKTEFTYIKDEHDQH